MISMIKVTSFFLFINNKLSK